MSNVKIVKPQEGYQMLSLSSAADIVIGGGAAGTGKTWVMLLECLRNIHVKNFGAVIFRRTGPQIRAEGGLWDASTKIFSKIRGAIPVESRLEWHFGNNVKIKLSHLEHKKNIYDWQGSEIPLICFDELTHFDREMFFYLLTRNRSTCGVKPYVRATCNPDPDHWVADFIKWWIGKDGFPIPERQGVLRYFMVDKGKFIWGDSYEEVIEKAWHILEPMITRSGLDPKDFIKSATFIGGSIYDNKALLEIDPGYLGNLNAQDEQTKARLLGGNWHVKVSGQDIYDFYKFADIFTNSHVEVELNRNKAKLAIALRSSKQDPKEIERLRKLTRKCITADIALKGSDKLVVFVWEGKMLIDFKVVAKSKGPLVISTIKGLGIKHGIPNSEILFDNDGVGQFVDGYIEGAIEFNNGARPIGGAFYNHLKSQCYFKSGAAVLNAEYYIPPSVAERKLDKDDKANPEATLREGLIGERKAIKQGKPDDDGKLQVIKKADMKVYLDGKSPDLLDAFMMREYFELASSETLATPDEYVANIGW